MVTVGVTFRTFNPVSRDPARSPPRGRPMEFDPEHAPALRFVVTVVSTDPPLACDVRAWRDGEGWRLRVAPATGEPPFSLTLAGFAPLITWLEQAALTR
jgi:hypothetical protein